MLGKGSYTSKSEMQFSLSEVHKNEYAELDRETAEIIVSFEETDFQKD